MLRFGLLVGFGLLGASAPAADFPPEAVEFFEKRIRPVLVEHCQKCHGEQQQKGGLRLDSRAEILRGGDTGPAMVPHEAKKSLLLEAISYDPDSYKMPPTGKLPDSVIADFTEWIRRGAAWPAADEKGPAKRGEFNLAERAQHWSFQPVKVVPPPEVSDLWWAANPIDRFIRARLATAGLKPGPQAAKAVLLRRLTLELTGLPPSGAELDAFLADDAPDAYARLVDRLLSSPHYGERWGRHWLDLVRFAETSGHEFDYDIPFAWPYRDYVIRAFNADLPYDRFVTEHIAGDLLATPRRDPATQNNESVLATAFYWFSQGKHSPVDIRADECDLMDNQLDVIGKTFQGLTIACARCHDHKFDPLTQADYYALAGFLQSSRQTLADYSPPENTQAIVDQLEAQDRQHHTENLETTLTTLKVFVARLPELLTADPAKLPDVPAETLTAWRKQVHDEAVGQKEHPLHLWAHWSAAPNDVTRRVQEWRRQPRRMRPDASAKDAATVPAPNSVDAAGSPWFREGFAFAPLPEQRPRWLHSTEAARPLATLIRPGTWAHSGAISPKLRGTLRSPTFTITQKYIDYWAHRIGGTGHVPRANKVGQISLIIDGFHFIRNPLYGHLTLNVPDKAAPVWMRQDVSQFIGSRAYIEIEDFDDGAIVVDRIEFRDGPTPQEAFHELIADGIRSAPVDDLADVALVYQTVCEDLLEGVRREQLYGSTVFIGREGRAAADLWNWLVRQPLALAPVPTTKGSVLQGMAERRRLESSIPDPRYVIAMTDGNAENEHLLIRGNHRKPGATLPRRNMEVFGVLESAPPETLGPAAGQPGSGREEWARSLVSPRNPLTARVIVNRLWQHHFGRGLVPTPDDFGKMGQPSSHPELLDWLAAELIEADWSLKHMQRLIVTSQAWQMTSRVTDPHAEEVDPNNMLLHRQSVQRLEAEAIRDSLLALSGRLDDRLYGPSVAPHLTPFMEGRGRPGNSGPLDGDGRRSLYLNVRRNFLSPFFLAFDFPTPFTTMGKRSSSNVPAQALALMNNPLVVQETTRWADTVRTATPDAAGRIARLYRDAFSRTPTDAEQQAALTFLADQAREYGTTTDDPRAWNDLAHVLVNVKEFVFVE
ncbi:MAG TPA: PSD1 and planctomycete cytochrome C domain-containing protein [Planctomycetaceae bacterium]|nr:PSD1 and planctomycete cytochrome C domain-containing protein [Planctomycetaceae bacterium]